VPAIFDSREKRHVALIIAVVFFEFLSFSIANPVLPRIIGELNETDIPTSAYLFGIFLISDAIQFFWAPSLGTISDRIGRRWILIVSVIAVSIGSFARYLADEIYIFFLVGILFGFAAATLSTAMSSVADVIDKERRTSAFGWITGSAVTAYAIGPIVGGFVSDIDIHLPLLITALVSLINMALVIFLIRESLPPEKRQTRPLGLKSLPFAAIGRQSREIKLLILLYFMAHFVLSMPHTFVVIYLIDHFGWSGTMIGIGLGLHMLVASVGQLLLSGRLSKKWGEMRVVQGSVLVGAVFLAALGLATPTPMVLASFALYAIVAMALPAISSLVSGLTPAEKQGEIQGIMASMMGLARVALFGGFGVVFTLVAERSQSSAASGLLFAFVGVALIGSVLWVRARIASATLTQPPAQP
jgi:MFS transporter, DHA1 family, tetracycline resistance protein